MNVKQNRNFVSVKRYRHILIKDILSACHTLHMDAERKERIDLAVKLNQYILDGKQAEVDAVFLIDKGHKDGKELHCVTKRGIIFILNESKYIKHENSFITALIARPNQVKRLYNDVGLKASQDILDKCERNQIAGLNK